MDSRKVEIARSGGSGAGLNRGSSGGLKASADSRSRVLEVKLDSLMSQVTDLTYNMEEISEKVEATRFASEAGDSQTSFLKTKLDSLMSEIANLTCEMGNTSVLVGAYKENVNKIRKSLSTITNHFRILERSVVRLQDDSQKTNLQSIESRLKALESSQNEPQSRALESIEYRLRKLESSQKQTSVDLDIRLKVLETSVNKIQDLDLPVIETRFSNLRSSFEERQDKDKAEAKHDVHELATVVDVLCNEKLNNEEAKTVKKVAERFGMNSTVNKLSNFIRNTLTLMTCIQLYKRELGQTLITHKNATLEMILHNFNTVSESAAGFCELSLEEMCCFLYSREIRVTAEQMFNAISKWVEADRISRTSMASLLLPAVQFSRCSLTFLRRISDYILVKAHSTVQLSLQEALKKFSSDVLFVIGGADSNGIIETLNKSKPSWTKQNISNGPSLRTFAFPAGHNILVLEVTNKRFRSFDTLTKQWNDVRPLPVFRYGMSAAIEGNELFVMGGLEHESKCNVYNIRLGFWTQVSSLNVGRQLPASSSLQGKIYCCGGFGSGQYLTSMEAFDPKEKPKGWTLAASMAVGRRGHCLVSCGLYLWAVGGWDGSYLADLERFEPTTNSWTKMVPMSKGRTALTASFFEDRLYAIGGKNGENLTTVEVYDPGENRWTSGEFLNNKRARHTSCVVNMWNADEYQWFVSF